MGKKHTVEFRQEAVRVALTSGLARKQVAADFGVGFSTLSHHKQQPTVYLPLLALGAICGLKQQNRWHLRPNRVAFASNRSGIYIQRHVTS